MKKKVVVALLGPEKDDAKYEARMEKWRPTVALTQLQSKDFTPDRIELLYQKQHEEILETVKKDMITESPKTKIKSHIISFDDPWNFKSVYEELQTFAKNYTFDTVKEDYFVHITTGTHVAQICLFILAYRKIIPGELLQTIPDRRKNKINKGFAVIDLDLLHDDLGEKLHKDDDKKNDLMAGLVTENKKHRQMVKEVLKVAGKTKEPILLTGPTGSGKTEFAKKIFDEKKSKGIIKKDIFMEVNCATLRGDSVLSALFGHAAGSFTGARKARDGYLKKADGGVLFLDEIGEIGLDVQAVLLRAIEEKKFLPFGSDKETESDFQLICGTNRDLQKKAAKGLFREDLLARINLWTYKMPPLKDRIEDIPLYVDTELNKSEKESLSDVKFTETARNRYLNFAGSEEALWKGNFRDLRSSLIRMSTLAEDNRIDTNDVEKEIIKLKKIWETPGIPVKDNRVEKILTEKISDLDRFEKVQLADVLDVCLSSSSLSEASRRLFSVSRLKKKSSNDTDRLKKYLEKFGFTWKSLKGQEEV